MDFPELSLRTEVIVEAETTHRRPRRWRLQFGLGGLLTLITVVAIWLAIQVDQAKHEKAAFASFQKSNAMIRFHYQRTDGDIVRSPVEWDSNIQPKPKGWLGNYLGDEYFHRIGMLAFLESKVTGEQLELLSELSALESLTLQGQPHLGDADMRHVGKLTSLKVLCLWDTQVSDQGVEQLKTLRSLGALGLSRTKITDKSIPTLIQFKNLELLELDETDVTQDGVDRLRKALPKCEVRHDLQSTIAEDTSTTNTSP